MGSTLRTELLHDWAALAAAGGAPRLPFQAGDEIALALGPLDLPVTDGSDLDAAGVPLPDGMAIEVGAIIISGVIDGMSFGSVQIRVMGNGNSLTAANILGGNVGVAKTKEGPEPFQRIVTGTALDTTNKPDGDADGYPVTLRVPFMGFASLRELTVIVLGRVVAVT